MKIIAEKIKTMKKKSSTILLFLLIIIALTSLVSADYDKAQLVLRDSGIVDNLDYCPLVKAYSDAGGSCNEDLALRIYSTSISDLSDNLFAGLVYSDPELKNFIHLTPKLGTLTDLQTMASEIKLSGDYFYRDIDITFDTVLSKFPGKLYAVISNDNTINPTDTLIELNPESDGWLVGANGGEPCIALNGYWLIDENCDNQIEFSSFDLDISSEKHKLYVTVTDAFYRVADTAIPIADESSKILLEIRDNADILIDSRLTNLNKKTTFESDTESVNIFVNGILEKTYTLDLESDEPVQLDSSQSTSSATSSQSPKIYGFYFDENSDSVVRYQAFLNTILDNIMGELVDYSLDQNGNFLAVLEPNTNIPHSRLDFVYLEFKVLRSWLFDNSLDNIEFYVIDGKELTPVPVNLINENENYKYYSVKLTRLSPFAIGKYIEQKPEPVPSIEKPDLETPSFVQGQTIIIDFRLLLLVFVIILIAIIIIQLMHNKK